MEFVSVVSECRVYGCHCFIFHVTVTVCDCTGELDDIPEVAFYMVGPIEEVVRNAEQLAAQQQ